MKDNPFNFAEGAQEQWVDFNPWTEFWLRVEQEWAEQFKFDSMYDLHFSQPCDCGSSVCDECNPGWDREDELEEEEYW